MGEVYRARDTTLHRDVALKVLPDLVSGDPERLARFEREAQLLAAVNHPHIGSIYGVVEAGAVRGLVLELVDGPTLAALIADGALPLEQALAIALQIAEALEAAHDRGIIHRDLKPANIKVGDDGTVKVLDFGLAKALDVHAAGSADVMNSPTVSMHGTHVGGILGSPAYMAPEQAMGRTVDRHADVWAFGMVLYEMLTGVRPFQGISVSEALAAIIKSDPNWDALPSGTPILITRLLRRCLAKDPRQRLGDMRDARLDIADALASPAAGAAPATPRSARRERLAWMATAVGLCAATVLALLAFGILQVRETPAAPWVTRFTIQPPVGVLGTGAPKISPDGRQVVFEAAMPGQASVLWLRSLESLTARPLPGTEGASLPFWSPDSRFIGFFAGGMLKKVALSGGPAVDLCAAPDGFGGSWSSEGAIVFAPTGNGALQRVPDSGGTPVPLTTLLKGKEVAHRWPQWLPDGRRFLYASVDGEGGDHTIRVASLESPIGEPLVAASEGGAVYVPPGTLLYMRESTLLHHPFDAARRQLSGEPTPIAGGIGDGRFSASNTGVLVYAASASEVRRRLVWVDRNREVTPMKLLPGLYTDPALSPDGRFVATVIRDATGSHIWVHDLERGSSGKLTFEGVNMYPAWSRDGRYLTFTRGGYTLMRVPADGSGTAEPFFTDEPHVLWVIGTSWSPDGRALAFQRNRDVFVREGDGSLTPVAATAAFEREGRFSTDGKWMAFRSDETGGDEVYVQSHPPGRGKQRISTGGGAQPMWAQNGRELFYKSGNRMMVVDVETGAAFKAGTPRVLFEMPFIERGEGNPARYAVSFDAKRFLVMTTVPEDEAIAGRSVPPFQVVLNWQASRVERSR